MFAMFSGSGSANTTAMPCSFADMLIMGAAVAAPIFSLLDLVRIIIVRLCPVTGPAVIPESA